MDIYPAPLGIIVLVVITDRSGFYGHPDGVQAEDEQAEAAAAAAGQTGAVRGAGHGRSRDRHLAVPGPARYVPNWRKSRCKTDFWKTNSSFRQEILVMRNVNSVTGNVVKDKKERYGAIRNYVRYRQSFHSGAFFVHVPGFYDAVHQLQAGFCSKTGTCSKRRSSTSGFLGVLMMMHICDWVTLYEMVPSVAGQRDKREYYWDDVKVRTGGARESTHSYSADRTVMRNLAVTDSKQIDSTGRATLKGFSQVNCD
ncbi:PREDICTED: beta-galactoside alpha-2,6-sialyltransferase 2-like [Branchiostoma belcheri]|uniref:beta-galactoside alpha-(2,6)-sialyltransferase n=1 Tax=Branchiostoma belcheri TaxID=7741 RepID=A0A6P5AKZ1_BRABE|nr:PREDICTED: beta-galactoside alpha-2,6-sialyltransferase 2-like [Branchiostoma belcheri]